MNCGKDLSSIMYGMKRIENDVFIFITYHKEESQDEKNYVDGKPDYADAFEDDLIFKWDSQIGKGLDSSYMKDVLEAERKHLLVKKSDAETSFFTWDNSLWWKPEMPGKKIIADVCSRSRK